MPAWLQESFVGTVPQQPALLFWRIGMALVLGGVVAGLYRWARRGQSISVTFLTTLVMLSALIAIATQVIGDNIARAFSLVGALSVVRFRTVVKDTQDTAFVIFAVVVGMAAGANQLNVALIGLIVMALGSFLLWPRKQGEGWSQVESRLSLRVTSADGIQSACEDMIRQASDRVALVGVSTARQGSAVDFEYRVRLKPGTSASLLVAELHRLEGVESVELNREPG